MISEKSITWKKTTFLKIVDTEFNGQVASIEYIAHGFMSWKYKIRHKNGTSYIFRIYPPGRETFARHDYEILTRSNHLSPQIPTPIKYDSNPPLAYLIYTYIDGQAANQIWLELTPTQKTHVLSEAFALSSKLNLVKIPGFGEICPEKWRGEFITEHDFIQSTIETGIYYLKINRQLSNKEIEAISEINKVVPSFLKNYSPGLVWTDADLSNIICKNNNFSGIVDFEGTLAGSFIMNLGYAYAASPVSDIYLHASNQLKLSASEYRLVWLYAILRGTRLAKYSSTRCLPTGATRQNLSDFLRGLIPAINNLKNSI